MHHLLYYYSNSILVGMIVLGFVVGWLVALVVRYCLVTLLVCSGSLYCFYYIDRTSAFFVCKYSFIIRQIH